MVRGGALLALVTVMGLPAAARAETPTDGRVYVVGDSVLLGARDAIVRGLPGWDVTVDAVVGRSLLGSIHLLEAQRATFGSTVVLALGANDGTDLVEWRRRVDLAMSALAGVPKVVWLTQRAVSSGRAAMNDELRAATTRWPNLEVLDWDATASAHPGYAYGDGLHLTPPGQAALADLLDHELTGPPETATTSPPPVPPSAAPVPRSAATTVPVILARREPLAFSRSTGVTSDTTISVGMLGSVGVALVTAAAASMSRRRRVRRPSRQSRGNAAFG